MLGICSRICHLEMWSHGHHDIRTCEMRARVEGTGTISTNAVGECAT
jgi:hypothetical protein